MRGVLLAIGIWLTAWPAWADARVTVLMDALGLPELVQQLRSEGLQDAERLNAQMLNGQGGAFWHEQVSRLYEVGPIEDMFFDALSAGLDDAALGAALDFFDSARGQRIIGLEIAARVAMRDPQLEEAAVAAFETLPTGDATADSIAQFIALNELLELNVALSMSTSFQFSLGLSDGKLLNQGEEQILADVWSSEGDIRRDALHWLHGYLMLAQAPLAPDDLDAYIGFAKTPAGQALNAALFSGYEAIFTDISYALGRAVALNAVGNEI